MGFVITKTQSVLSIGEVFLRNIRRYGEKMLFRMELSGLLKGMQMRRWEEQEEELW